jgi:general secretion pathway protein A
MYKAFFNLTDNPFSISPDPKYLYMSDRHTEALTHLLYGLRDGGGFVLLTGEVGTGKTTVSRCLRQQLPEDTDLAFILNPSLSTEELLASVCDAFQLTYPQPLSLKSLFDSLHHFLLQNNQQGRRTLLVIDEAQHLIPDVLEQLRLLTNLETDSAKLLQIVLIGQPELQQLLRQPLLRQLAQRITARYHLLPLDLTDVDAYVRFRLQVAGCLQSIFTPSAIRTLHRLSGGVPRVINLICERALLGAFAAGRERINDKLLAQAAYEAIGVRDEGSLRSVLAFSLAGMLMLSAGWFGWQHWGFQPLHPIKKVMVPVALPPDAKLVKRFDQALADASYEDQAIQQLYRAWGFETAIDEATCNSALRAKLGCVQGQASVDEIIKLNYPVVVRLNGKHGQDSYITILHIADQEVDILLADERWLVSRAWLEKVWGQDYTLLWQLPDSSNTLISKRSGPADVLWLESVVSQALQQPARKKISRFDATLAGKIRQFQTNEGLTADGVAGEQTLLRLVIRSHEPVPRLNGRIPAQQIVTSPDDAEQNERGAS